MPDSQVIKPQPKGGVVTTRQDLVGEVISTHDQTAIASAAAAAAAKAELEARIVQAMHAPRDEDQFREDILKCCRHRGFAEISLYNKPVGRKKNAETGRWEEAFATDFSVRFIESALQYYGNIHSASRIEWETGEQLKLTVAVLDVQRNIGYSTDAVLDKLVERKEIKQGRKTRGMRENSYGDTVYLVEATKDEVRNITGAERSKLLRDNGKRLLPRHILDECRELIDKTLADETAKDPDSAKKRILDRFAALGISATALKEYLARPVEMLTAKDLTELTPLYNGLKEGDFTWTDVMRSKSEASEGEKAGTEQSKGGKLRDKILAGEEPPKEG